jgi:hypothetical protein
MTQLQTSPFLWDLLLLVKIYSQYFGIYIIYLDFYSWHNLYMPIDPITISTLVAVIFTGITQLVQLYFDYKLAEHQQVGHVYKVYESNCCSSMKDKDT